MQRQFHLRRSADFERVRTQGRVWRHPFLTLGVIPNGLSYNRFGFITGRRLGNAVTRNRVRRVLREIARLSMSKLKAGYDLTFVARNEIIDQPYNDIQQVLDELFARARLIDEQRN